MPAAGADAIYANILARYNSHRKTAEIEGEGSLIEAGLNAQLQLEMYSANLYEQMAVYFDVGLRLLGFASFFMKQAAGEREHAAKLLAFMKDCGLQARISDIPAPPPTFSSPLEVLEKTLEHEQRVTHSLHALRELAMRERNHATEVLMDWYVTEQVEELDLSDEILAKVRLAGDSGPGLLLIDADLAKR